MEQRKRLWLSCFLLANGEIIVSLLPVNVNLPWITPAVFQPHLVPEELMAQGLTLTVEEVIRALTTSAFFALSFCSTFNRWKYLSPTTGSSSTIFAINVFFCAGLLSRSSCFSAFCFQALREYFCSRLALAGYFSMQPQYFYACGWS